MSEQNYWKRIRKRKLSRRNLLQASGRASLGGQLPCDPPSALRRHAGDDLLPGALETLTKYSPDGLDPQPHLAESWEFNDDQTMLQVKLRPGLEFHDSKPLTAEEVVKSLERTDDEDVQNSQVRSIYNKYVGKSTTPTISPSSTATPASTPADPSSSTSTPMKSTSMPERNGSRTSTIRPRSTPSNGTCSRIPSR